VSEDRLNALLGRILNDLGGAYSVPLVRMGEQLGLYAAMKAHGPMNSAALAEHTGCAERYLREWLANQSGCGYVNYEPASGEFSLDDAQAAVFADRDSPV